MKIYIALFTLFLCATQGLSAETNTVTMRCGNLIGKHDMSAYQKVEHDTSAYQKIEEDMRAYQKTEQLKDGSRDIPDTQIAMRKVGDGVFCVFHTPGAGFILDMTYTVPADGEKRVVFKVKEFNPKTGELTILVPNKPSEATSPKGAAPQ